MRGKTVHLLVTAGILMLLAGCIFGLIGQWIYAALIWVGALGYCVAALNFKNHNNKDTLNEEEGKDGK